METSLNLVTTICLGLLIGTELAVSAFINPVLAQLGDKAEAQATRLFAKRLGGFMPFWYGFAFLLLAAQSVAARHQAGFAWIVAAAALWVLVIAFSVLVLVPINNRIVAMSLRRIRAIAAHPACAVERAAPRTRCYPAGRDGLPARRHPHLNAAGLRVAGPAPVG
jgi:hypothetical protein